MTKLEQAFEVFKEKGCKDCEPGIIMCSNCVIAEGLDAIKVAIRKAKLEKVNEAIRTLKQFCGDSLCDSCELKQYCDEGEICHWRKSNE